jgi:ABC-type transport system substrate-binding protein
MYASIPAMLPVLRTKKDFRRQPGFASSFFVFNTASPPFDDVRVRYALNMAIDKRPIAELCIAGSIPGVSLVPSSNRYQPPRSLPIPIDGVTYDVLAFDPRAARALLAAASERFPARMEYVCGNFPDSRMIAQVLQQQFREHLGIALAVIIEEVQTWVQSVQNRTFRHLADWGSMSAYLDPVWFLDLFNDAAGYGTGWSDPSYKAALNELKATKDPALRMARLANCERRLLQAMPILPYCHEVWGALTKPFVHGLGYNQLARRQFKYAWIDANWRPQ